MTQTTAFGLRTLIIGNSGSGKTTLARCLAGVFQVPAVDLDRVHWTGWDGGIGHKRDEGIARQMAGEEAAKPRWVIEGVYGWLAEAVMPRAVALIWLDVPWGECRDGLVARGPWAGVDAAGFAEFLTWAEAYATRQTSTSFDGHARIFAAFAGHKMRLGNRSAVNAFMNDLTANTP